MNITRGIIILVAFMGVILSAGYFTMGSPPNIVDNDGLYERLGEKEGITKIVRSFIFKLVRDMRIKVRFAYINMPRFRALLIEQVCEATGGPCSYSGANMGEAHKGLEVTKNEFKIFIEHFVEALAEASVGHEDQEAIANLFESMRGDIVGH